MSVEAIIAAIEAKIGSLSGLPPDLSDEYDALRAEFAKKPKAESKPAEKKPAKKK